MAYNRARYDLSGKNSGRWHLCGGGSGDCGLTAALRRVWVRGSWMNRSGGRNLWRAGLPWEARRLRLLSSSCAVGGFGTLHRQKANHEGIRFRYRSRAKVTNDVAQTLGPDTSDKEDSEGLVGESVL